MNSEKKDLLNDFIEKINADEALKERAKGFANDAGKTAELASELGFALSSEDFEQVLSEGAGASYGELDEAELDNIAGGAGTQNRYNPNSCPRAGEALYECVGFLRIVWCDHYRMEKVGAGRWRHWCAMGGYDYVGTELGKRN